MSKKTILIILAVLLSRIAFTQVGSSVYSFLDLPVSSRLAALGGTNVSIRDNDLNFAFRNPALLTSEADNVIGLNMANHLADIVFGSAMYSRNFGNNNHFAVGIQYVDYGDFLYADELNTMGDNFISNYGEEMELTSSVFTAKDMALSLIYARPINDRLTAGWTLKPIVSVFEMYTSFGIALDGGIHYNDTAKLFSAGVILRNIGTQIKGYYSNEDGQHYESLPFEIQMGMTKKFQHAPLRLSLTLHNLQHFDLSYLSLNQEKTTPTETEEETDNNIIGFADMAFRHAIVGVEFVPSKSFYLIASYNHRRHQELKMPGFKSAAGFSFGGGIKLYKFQVGFGMSQFQVGNYSYQFSISTSLNEFNL